MSKERNTQSKQNTSSLASSFASLTKGFSVGQLAVGFATLCLITIGIVMVYSASSIELVSNGKPAYSEALKQVLFVGIAIGLIAIAGLLLKKGLTLYAVWGFYALCMLGLLATFAIGTTQYGASRWIDLGFTTVQPSEFAKIAFVLLTSEFVKQCRDGAISPKQLALRVVILVFLPLIFLLVTQSDLGTSIICALGVVAVLYMSEIYNPVYFLICIAALVVGVAFMMLITPYRMARLTAFLDPWADADGNGFQYIHSFKALAAGGLFGVGIGDSYQKLLYLPMASTDFIFAIIGEELGLVGALFVIALFIVLLYGGFKMASEAKSDFSSLVCAGLTIMLVFQAFLNIFCVIGAAPITGKPLPFISSGGSSMVSSVFLVGLVLLFGSGVGESDVYERRRENLRIVSTGSAASRTGDRMGNRQLGSSRRRISSEPARKDDRRRPRAYGRAYESRVGTKSVRSSRGVERERRRSTRASSAHRPRYDDRNSVRSRDARESRRAGHDERSSRRYR